MVQQGWQVSPSRQHRQQETPWQVMVAIAQATFECAPPIMDDSSPPRSHDEYKPIDRLSFSEVDGLRNPEGGLTALFFKGRQLMLCLMPSKVDPGHLIIDEQLFCEFHGDDAPSVLDAILHRAQKILNGMETVRSR